MIYSQNIPDPKTAKREGIRMARSIVLPPYLASNAFFVDWLDCMDQLFETTVDDKIEVIKNIRNMWVTNPQLEQKVVAQEMIKQTDWSVPEQAIVLKQLNMLGLQLSTPTVMFDEYSFMNFCRFLGYYWLQKGTHTFMDFVNFCTGTQFVIKNCWTENYVDFYPEGSEEIGTPIWEGGTWYPTTHVVFQSINPTTTDVNMLGQLFYEIANYNLVLYSIDSIYNLPITNDPSGDSGGQLLLNTGLCYHLEYNLYSDGYEVPASTFGFEGSYLENPDQSHFYTDMSDGDTMQDVEDQETIAQIVKILDKIRRALYTLGHH